MGRVLRIRAYVEAPEQTADQTEEEGSVHSAA